ncbi:Na+/H+ antiporter subunit E [Aquibacillus sediminis]|uniref:Na+/H+ antiporter subunit E n=1 Tax=Aquibacillus sediminis TaxID=2574734 RepID=UPI0011081DE6|nr:Na+/H+ antiporter subunit E [Aquibacillus sediminis]
MALQILLNIGLALVWMLLNDSFTLVDFMIGYLIGVGLLYVLRRFLEFDYYFTRVIAIFKLIYIFIKEMILANLKLAKIVISPKMDINPGIIAYETKLETDWQKTLLASLIGLTPGTLVTAFSDDETIMYVHHVDIEDKQEAIDSIRNNFEKTILEVTDNV